MLGVHRDGKVKSKLSRDEIDLMLDRSESAYLRHGEQAVRL